MNRLYHASPIADIKILKPAISNHGEAFVYFSRKRENVLVYLSNAVEKYCRETGFTYQGKWEKWGPYGFNGDGTLRLEEYYPNATYDTYKGVPGYIYEAEEGDTMRTIPDIQDAIVSSADIPVADCEYVSDAYEEIMKAVEAGKITILKYGDLSPEMRKRNEQMIREEYENAKNHPEYRHFLEGKFDFL